MPDVSQDPRYIKLVPDVRSELAIPLLLKDRCIGVFDLESPELDAFSKRDVEILTLLASQAAVAIENARLYEDDSRQRGAAREGAALRAARAGGAAADRTCRSGSKGVDVAARVRAGARARRRLPRLPVARSRTRWSSPSATCRARACRRRSTARLPPSWCAARTFRRRYLPERSSPGERAVVDQHDPAPAPARGVLLHALLRRLRSEAAHRDAGQLGPAVSDPLRGDGVRADRAARRAARLVPGIDLRRGDVRAARRATCSCSAPTACSRR